MSDCTSSSQLGDAASEYVRKEFPPLDGPVKLTIFLTPAYQTVRVAVEAIPSVAIASAAPAPRRSKRRPEFEHPQ